MLGPRLVSLSVNWCARASCLLYHHGGGHKPRRITGHHLKVCASPARVTLLVSRKSFHANPRRLELEWEHVFGPTIIAEKSGALNVTILSRKRPEPRESCDEDLSLMPPYLCPRCC